MFMFLFLFFSKLFLCSFFIISSEKWFNFVVTFFFEKAKNLGRSDDAKRRKKEDGLVTTNVKFSQSWGRLSRLLEN